MAGCCFLTVFFIVTGIPPHITTFLIFCLCRLIAYLSRLRKAIYPRCGFKMCTLDVGLSGSDREVSREIFKIF